MSGKRYPEEFKIEAVKQVIDRGHSVSSVATRLDITTHSLYAWIKKYGPDSSTNFPENAGFLHYLQADKVSYRTVMSGFLRPYVVHAR